MESGEREEFDNDSDDDFGNNGFDGDNDYDEEGGSSSSSKEQSYDPDFDD